MSSRSGSGRRCSAAGSQPLGPLQLLRKLGAPLMRQLSSEMCVLFPFSRGGHHMTGHVITSASHMGVPLASEDYLWSALSTF